jgi:hypothetical protein
VGDEGVVWCVGSETCLSDAEDLIYEYASTPRDGQGYSGRLDQALTHVGLCPALDEPSSYSQCRTEQHREQ